MNLDRSRLAVLFLTMVTGACGHAPGTQPHDMSAAEHLSAAQSEESLASQEHRERAAQHRAASQSLRDAEAHACAGLRAEERDTSPFVRGTDVQSVRQLREVTIVGKARMIRDSGATVVFRPTPGLTAEWLQRIIACHLARSAAGGHDMPEMPYCPLVPRGAQARVRSLGDGFAVDVYADDADTAAEIWRRAQQITHP